MAQGRIDLDADDKTKEISIDDSSQGTAVCLELPLVRNEIYAQSLITKTIVALTKRVPSAMKSKWLTNVQNALRSLTEDGCIQVASRSTCVSPWRPGLAILLDHWNMEFDIGEFAVRDTYACEEDSQHRVHLKSEFPDLQALCETGMRGMLSSTAYDVSTHNVRPIVHPKLLVASIACQTPAGKGRAPKRAIESFQGVRYYK